MFTGEYHYNLDEKGRITIPSKIRFDLGSNVVVTRGLDGCLYLYSYIEFEKILNKYKELPDTKNKRQFMRIFLSGANVCEFDKQGRINIPISLLEYANIKKECIIVGVLDRLEIWSKSNWEEFISSNESSLSELADSLFMGDKNA